MKTGINGPTSNSIFSLLLSTLLVGAVEYTDFISAEG